MRSMTISIHKSFSPPSECIPWLHSVNLCTRDSQIEQSHCCMVGVYTLVGSWILPGRLRDIACPHSWMQWVGQCTKHRTWIVRRGWGANVFCFFQPQQDLPPNWRRNDLIPPRFEPTPRERQPATSHQQSFEEGDTNRAYGSKSEETNKNQVLLVLFYFKWRKKRKKAADNVRSSHEMETFLCLFFPLSVVLSWTNSSRS